VVEAVFVFGLVALLAFAGLVLPLVPPTWVLGASFGLVGIGMLLGVPTGFWYHVKLRAALARHGAPPERWWVRPVSLHGQVDPLDRPGVMRWFVAGGVGFVITVLGCFGIVLGVVLQGFHARALLFG
jgi:hypothetical protein